MCCTLISSNTLFLFMHTILLSNLSKPCMFAGFLYYVQCCFLQPIYLGWHLYSFWAFLGRSPVHFVQPPVHLCQHCSRIVCDAGSISSPTSDTSFNVYYYFGTVISLSLATYDLDVNLCVCSPLPLLFPCTVTALFSFCILHCTNLWFTAQSTSHTFLSHWSTLVSHIHSTQQLYSDCPHQQIRLLQLHIIAAFILEALHVLSQPWSLAASRTIQKGEALVFPKRRDPLPSLTQH